LQSRPTGRRPFDAAKLRQLGESIWRTLGGVAQSIRSTMSPESRRKGEAYFEITKADDGRLEGCWKNGQSEPIDIRALFINEGQLVGNIEESMAMALAQAVFDDLGQKQWTLPGFGVFDREPGRVTLIWTRPETRAE
jgi:hypothetical protein